MGNAVQGAYNTTNFRESLIRGIIPDKETITFEGLFNQYFFNYGIQKEIKELVEPFYSFASLPNWRTGDEEHYMAVGLTSSEDGKGYRAPMNCIVVLDISGSMGAYFDADYRDGLFIEGEGGVLIPTKKTKMEIAKECLLELSKVMKEEENFGIVLFDDKIDVLQPLRKMKDIDREKLESAITGIQPRGGTDMEMGMRTAIEMIEDLMKENIGKSGEPTNNRIIFLTDAQPNIGGGPNTLTGISRRAATKSKIYTTFIGIGLDFGVKLVEQLSKIRGSNYCSVHNRKEFVKILREDFNYFTTPLVHDCVLFLESEGIEIRECFGTPHGHQGGVLMSIQTLSASPKDEVKGVKGGMVVVRLKEKLTPKLDPSKKLVLTLRYEPELENVPQQEQEEEGEPKRKKKTMKKQFQHMVDLEKKLEEMEEKGILYENNGIRKAILLVLYCEFMKEILEASKNRMENDRLDRNYGSQSSNVIQKRFTEEQIKELKTFKEYFVKEMEEIKDPKLSKELDALDRMIYQK